ncbi:MAG: lamin tail domain-containing protein, partial [Saprospiraceae bacterium]
MSKLHSLLGVLLLLFLNISFANAQLYVNEWMAANNNTLTDTAGEYDDWIEIYNSSSNPVDIAGYFLSDDVTDLVKWQIPNGSPATTTIPANGFLLLWADNDTDQGANHLAFKLGANGEPIVLTAPDGTTILDQVLYGPQSDDISYGRGMDGSATFQFFVNATPGISNNTLTGPLTYNAIFDIPVLEGSDDAEEPVNQSFTAISENILNIVNDWSGDQKVGIRFQNIPFPQGAIINKARIQFTSAFPTASVGPSNLTIEAELSANSSTFSNAANDVSNRPTGSESINWQPEEWTVLNAATEKERTPDLSVLVQEVVDQSNWSEDNAISFIFSGTGKRIPWAADNGNENVVPRLFIEGELPAPTSLMEGVVINEIAARGTSFEDEFGECDDWIELYNNTSTTAAIGGLFLTDDPDNLAKWQIASPVEIPAGGFQTLWIDKDTEQGGLHANFKLSGSGDQIILVQWIDNEFVILDQVDFGEVPFQASYRRTTDGGNTWKTFGEITPNATNENALGWLLSPTIDLQTGAYNGTQTVSISHPDPSTTIYYTTDGSEPSVNATLYSSLISISENTSLKAKAFANGVVESLSAQASYLIDENLNIPALFINTDPDNFFDDNTGIYVEGTNGIPGFCVNDPVNWNQDWEVPVNLSMITEDGNLAFSVNAGAKIGGGCSRQYGLKSLNIYTRETKYGSEKINYPLFAGRDHDNYERIKLRNS